MKTLIKDAVKTTIKNGKVLRLNHKPSYCSFDKDNNSILKPSTKIETKLINLSGELLLNHNTNKRYIENTINFIVTCWNLGAMKDSDYLRKRSNSFHYLKTEEGNTIPAILNDFIDQLIMTRRYIYGDDLRSVDKCFVKWITRDKFLLDVACSIHP
ncbi:hypothetical protein [Endozoicomonas atrinae]|uniref:hypothetical protein n=1 Tax=Endozoicomonas atrinae TaxID=1333660 RepID=UPI000825F43A|nr:hypothetical protein [Endozoicomonas atrinae]